MKTKVPHQKITFTQYSGSGIGCAPSFSFPKNTEEVIGVLETLEKVFNPDGSYNLNYDHLESYALCLHEEKKYKETLDLLNTITGQETSNLLPKQESGEYQMVVNQKGKLGLEGLFVYACLLKEAGEHKKAGSLFKQIVDSGPFRCGIRGGDIFARSAQEVMNLNAYPFLEKFKYSQILQKAKADQY